MATEPIAGARYALGTDSGDVQVHLERAVRDLAAKATPPRFSTTTARDDAYTAAITAGTITSIENGMVCAVNGVPYRRIGDTWREDRLRKWSRSTGIGGAGIAVTSGGSAETGFGAIAALSNITLHEAGALQFVATFRAGGGTGAAQCTVKINTVQVGNVAISRADSNVTVAGQVSLAAGTHSISMRVDAIGGDTNWVDAICVLTEGAAE